jgi:hypothetical protein
MLFTLLSLAAAWVAHAGDAGLTDLRALIDDEFAAATATQVERDATVHPEDVAEGCAGGVNGRTLVHFTLSTFNEGTADLVLGDPGCPDCELQPGPTCENPLFECSPLEGHGHPHFSRYALYELLPRPDASAAATGHKQGFCLEDSVCENRVYNCFNQGLSLGCKDVYPGIVLGCQYVDATELPGGRYLLRATVNYERILEESNYDNNTDQRPVDVCEGITGPKVRVRVSKKSPGEWRWKMVARSEAQVPLADADPFKDGAWVRITDLAGRGVDDDRRLVDVEIPGRPGSGHCGPKDGWKRNGTAAPFYVNESGFVDAGCTVPSDGLRRVSGSVRTRERAGVASAKVVYRMAGVSPAPVPSARLRVEVGLGVETGPCWTGTATCTDTKCAGDSAAGAFVDP